MTAAFEERRDRDGWRFRVNRGAERLDEKITAELLDYAVAAARGEIPRSHRRSRHATTYRIRFNGRGAEVEAFIKLLDAPRGLRRFKALMRGSDAAHVAHVTAALNAAGFRAAPVLVRGSELAGRRTMIVTRGAEGAGLLRIVAARGAGALAQKRAVLRALGGEVARLHRGGFVHGDLTPYNVFVVRGEPPRFVFIDHERTGRVFRVGRRRRQLRNLVQLGRFDLPGLTRSDRMRVWRAYLEGLSVADRRAQHILTKRVAAMLLRRLIRDRALQRRRGG